MECIQCNNLTIIKCKNQECKNQVRKCRNCFYDFKLKRVDKQFDFSKLYCPFSMMQQYADSNLDKAVETIWCGDCNYYTQLYLKYGRNIPLISLQFEDIKINVEFDINPVLNDKKTD